METYVRYLKSDNGIQTNSKLLDINTELVVNFTDAMKEGIIEEQNGTYKIIDVNYVNYIPYAINFEYKLQNTVYCFDDIVDSKGVKHSGFFATLFKVEIDNKKMYGIEPLLVNGIDLNDQKDKLYWVDKIINVVGSIHPNVNWINPGDRIFVSKSNCNINPISRTHIDLKVKCPTCKEFHPCE